MKVVVAGQESEQVVELEMVQVRDRVHIRERGVDGGIILDIGEKGIRLAACYGGRLPVEGEQETVVVLRETL